MTHQNETKDGPYNKVFYVVDSRTRYFTASADTRREAESIAKVKTEEARMLGISIEYFVVRPHWWPLTGGPSLTAHAPRSASTPAQ